MTTKALLEPVLAALSAVLRPQGYRKSGATFRQQRVDTLCIVSLQSSSASTSVHAKVTVNLGVHVPRLQDPQRPEAKPSIWSAHWRERIGFLMPEHEDIWWSIRTAADAASVATVIARNVEQHGLPALDRVASVSALRQLWESGRSAGITEGQRIRYLQELGAIDSMPMKWSSE